ncbi:hypothetical protein GCM10011491_15180 [Brucella endophytica]|uniref:Lytic murein transglycosylase n=1 Tax=Brucella endophytica TaxID=1963359 RepID=A0A916SA90_9HYPH|nr:hypothetical protein GCM10011491_15180 [Brucella endophytica]
MIKMHRYGDENTPLCPAGHLPHKGGDRLTQRSALILLRLRLVPDVYKGVISPPVGEMPGRAEGGELRSRKGSHP